MRDTSETAERLRLMALRRMEPVERLRQMFELSESARRLALVGLRHRNPSRTDAELIELLLGRRLPPPDTGTPTP